MIDDDKLFKFNGKKPKLKVDRLEQPINTSKHAWIKERVNSPERKSLFGLFKFFVGYDKKKTF